MKRTVTHKNAEAIFESVQTMSVFAELIEIEHAVHLVDHRFKNPLLNQHLKRVRESLQVIQRELGNQIKGKDVEYFKYEHCPLLYTIYKRYMFQEKEVLEDINNQIEELDKKQVA